jgi:hypothetical protein
MVDVMFSSRARHFIPLPVLRNIADTALGSLPEEIAYIGADGHQAIKSRIMGLFSSLPYRSLIELFYYV